MYMIIVTCEARDTVHLESLLDMMQICLVESGACSIDPDIHPGLAAEDY